MSIGLILAGLLFFAAVAGVLLTPRLKFDHFVIIGTIVFLLIGAVVLSRLHFGAQNRAATAACRNNVRHLEGAIKSWSLEQKKTAGEAVMTNEVAEFFRGGFPRCPMG